MREKITFYDITTYDKGWFTKEDACELDCLRVVSEGDVFHEDEHFLRIALLRHEDREQYSSIAVLPIGVIISREKIDEK